MSKDKRLPFEYKGIQVDPRGIFGPRQSFGQIDSYKQINGRTYSRWWRVNLSTGIVNAESKEAARKVIDGTDSVSALESP